MAWLDIAKNGLTTREVLDRYLGPQSKSYFQRDGKYICPFHGDKNPSISINPKTGKFKCFGCGVSGDGVDFVQMYFKVNQYDALKILDSDFHLGFENYVKADEEKIKKIKKEKEEKKRKIDNKNACIHIFSQKIHWMLRVLEDIYKKYAPTPNENMEEFALDEKRVHRSMWAVYQIEYLKWLLECIHSDYYNIVYPSFNFDLIAGINPFDIYIYPSSENKHIKRRHLLVFNLVKENSISLTADKYY